ncbi:hypothetical protein KR018_000731 [Drosophila ironensis]|nr:hypothetical protein KR018_000731 [Drosophila ironensis]
MGITGLIPFVEKASSRLQLQDIRGSTVAVDTYCWLHKGVFGCAEKLARGEDTDVYINYCLKYVTMLLSYDIKPILVFDGQHLPAKALTEKRRRESRQKSKDRAAELLRMGRTKEAFSHMRRCVDVTHDMALRLIKECRLRNIDCIVAPYEADAQMAWLNKSRIADYIITEDSDLTLFGAQKIIFKLDLNGTGLLVEADKLHLAMGCREDKYHFDKFRRMCILSGCDYLDSLPGIGLAKACKFILKTEQEDMRIALKKIPGYLNMRNLEVDDEYIENFLKAEATFRHMYIYNPLERRMERLCALEDWATDERYCSNAGTLLQDSNQALHLALGNLNPFSLKQLDTWTPESSLPTPKNVKRSKHKSIWHGVCPKVTPLELEKKPTPGAFTFKKVDFDSQSIEQEIEANQRLEEAKPTEEQLFSMYNFKPKRARSPSREEVSPPPSPVTKTRHNPFAKEALQKSPAVCENGSLLRLLSPKKTTPLSSGPNESKINSLKRSIFAKEHVEVRSRFFSTQSEEKKEPEQESPVTAKRLKLQKQEKIEEEQEGRESEAESEPSASQESTSEASKASGIRIKSMDELRDNSRDATESDSNNNDAIIILSDDSCGSNLTPVSSTTTSSTSNSAPMLPGKRRLGLSRSNSASTIRKGAPKTRSNGKLGALSENQTKLSMFGFQKRPALK